MHVLNHWFATNANLLAVIVTVAVAILVVWFLCSDADKDDVFRHHGS